MKKLILIFALLAMAGCKQSDTTENGRLQKYFSSHSIPDAVLGSVDREGHTAFYNFGPSVWNGKDTVNPDNIFRIFSMTKAIATVAAMQLVEKGMLTLDEPLNKLMPEMDSIPVFDDAGVLTHRRDTITLRHLLTHTAGFGYKFTSSRLAAFHPEKWKYADDPRLFKPGTSWLYGTSLDWVGHIVEKVSGKNLEVYLRQNVTGPLQMNSTWFNVPAALQSKIVSWGERDPKGGFTEYPRIPADSTSWYSAGGGLFGSPRDYLKFLQCILNKGELNGVRILKSETIDIMIKDQLPKNVSLYFEGIEKTPDSLRFFQDPKDRFGIGWAIEANPDEKIRPQGAAYWSGAANSYYTLDVERGVAVVYFSNFMKFNDPDAFKFYKMFEKDAYSKHH